MHLVNLQHKAQAMEGKAEKYWFENPYIGLQSTLFHRIEIPLSPFDSGLSYESQPVNTAIVIEWLELNLPNPDDLNELEITSEKYESTEASFYIGGAHNWCNILKLQISRIKDDLYDLVGLLYIDFENEGVAKNEQFEFRTSFRYVGEMKLE